MSQIIPGKKINKSCVNYLEKKKKNIYIYEDDVPYKH